MECDFEAFELVRITSGLVAEAHAAMAQQRHAFVSVGLLSHIVGKWTWYFLLVRLFLSVCQHTYGLIVNRDPHSYGADQGGMC